MQRVVNRRFDSVTGTRTFLARRTHATWQVRRSVQSIAHDRRRVGRRQECLVGRDVEPAERQWRAGAGRIRHDAEAFREFLAASGLDRRIADRLASLDVDDVRALARSGEEIRSWLVDAPLPKRLEEEIRSSYQWLKGESSSEISVAMRSSATAEDLPDASFAGQQETF